MPESLSPDRNTIFVLLASDLNELSLSLNIFWLNVLLADRKQSYANCLLLSFISLSIVLIRF